MDKSTPGCVPRAAFLIGLGVIAGVVLTVAAQSAQKAASRVEASAPPAKTIKLASKNEELPAPMPVAPLSSPDAANASTPSQSMKLAPGTEYAETASGYPIVTGGRAVGNAVESTASSADGSAIALSSNMPYVVDETGAQIQTQQPVGRNGLLSNPCVDPPSTRGAAYGRAY